MPMLDAATSPSHVGRSGPPRYPGSSRTADRDTISLPIGELGPRHNRLLAALPAADLDRLRGILEPVRLRPAQVLYESDGALKHAYFPTSAVLSLVCVFKDGSSAEAAVVGCDGSIGVIMAPDGARSPLRVVVQGAGGAYRAERSVLQREFARAGALQQLILRHGQALMMQIAQTAACNRRHTVEQQLCRRLLLVSDRSQSEELHMTHEQIAQLLGVRREGVTEAAGKLQGAGLIQCGRGRVRLASRSGLEARACECYRAVRSQYALLLPGMPSS